MELQHLHLIIQGILSGTDQISLLDYQRDFLWTNGILVYSVGTGANVITSIIAMVILKKKVGEGR